MAKTLSVASLNRWLKKYKAAWESRDSEAAAALFTGNAEYYWTPFEEPKRGRREIAQAWKNATSRQEDIFFSYSILAVDERTCFVHWHASFVRLFTGKHVELDGIIRAEFDENNECYAFCEWWHSSE